MAEQRYLEVLAVIADGLTIKQVAEKVGVSRQTLHAWLARYEAEGLEGLKDRSHRPVTCPHQMSAGVEAALLELRRSRPYLGPRRLVHELGKRGVVPVPSESGVYRALAAVVEALEAGRAAGCEDWLRDNIAAELTAADPDTVERLVTGTFLHAKRRAEEMAASSDMLRDLGVEPLMASASRDLLRRIVSEQ